MTDRPILFSAPMIHALLGGRKTQTRRTLYAERKTKAGMVPASATLDPRYPAPLVGPLAGVYCTLSAWHRVQVGDRLWVREGARRGGTGKLFYRADGEADGPTKWRTAIHMPRAWSRLTLVVTATKIERLQDITDADAQAEGARRFADIPGTHVYPSLDCRWSMENPTTTDQCLSTARLAFGNFWVKLNGLESWHANHWVVALTCTAHRCNIDKMGNV